jgi:hypothetical protein
VALNKELPPLPFETADATVTKSHSLTACKAAKRLFCTLDVLETAALCVTKNTLINATND